MGDKPKEKRMKDYQEFLESKQKSHVVSGFDVAKLNKHLLASRMKMNKGTFNNKLNPNHLTQFTEKEMFQLKRILIELRTDLESIDTDFNEALSIIAKGKK